VYLPLTEEETGKKNEFHEEIPRGTETVLLAEDNTELRTLTKTFLENNGYSVVEASDGNEAVKKFIKYAPDLAILDVVMPKKDGRAVYEAIKKQNPNVKVLFISGYTDDIIHQRQHSGRGFGFFSKPYSHYDFLRTVRKNIGCKTNRNNKDKHLNHIFAKL
jgi:CheY-like chemotaxis protein